MTEQPVETMQEQPVVDDHPITAHYVCFDCPEMKKIAALILAGVPNADLPEVRGICGTVVPWSDHGVRSESDRDKCVMCVELIPGHMVNHLMGRS